MKLERYETREEIEAAIRRREENLEAVRQQRDAHYEGWNFEAGQEFRKIERNIERLKAKLRNLNGKMEVK